MSTGSSKTRTAAMLIVALPPVIVAISAVVLVTLGVFGLNPLWSVADLTMAEAAALRDQASVAVMAREGIDPSARMRVRAGIVDNRTDLALTPAEAAVRADRTEILDVLFANGLELDRNGAGTLICLARKWDSEEAGPYLAARFPGAVNQPCSDIADPAAPVAR